MSETETVFQSFRLWSQYIQSKINLVASHSCLSIHVSLPLVLEAFSLTLCLFFHGLAFSLSWFPHVFQTWSAIPLPVLSWQLSGWWKGTSINSMTSINKHTVNSGDYPMPFPLSSLPCICTAGTSLSCLQRDSNAANFYPRQLVMGSKETLYLAWYSLKNKSEQKSHWI